MTTTKYWPVAAVIIFGLLSSAKAEDHWYGLLPLGPPREATVCVCSGIYINALGCDGPNGELIPCGYTEPSVSPQTTPPRYFLCRSDGTSFICKRIEDVWGGGNGTLDVSPWIHVPNTVVHPGDCVGLDADGFLQIAPCPPKAKP